MPWTIHFVLGSQFPLPGDQVLTGFLPPVFVSEPKQYAGKLDEVVPAITIALGRLMQEDWLGAQIQPLKQNNRSVLTYIIRWCSLT